MKNVNEKEATNSTVAKNHNATSIEMLVAQHEINLCQKGKKYQLQMELTPAKGIDLYAISASKFIIDGHLANAAVKHIQENADLMIVDFYATNLELALREFKNGFFDNVCIEEVEFCLLLAETEVPVNGFNL